MTSTLLNWISIVCTQTTTPLTPKPYEKDILEGDRRFWYARGEVVSEFLDKLWQLAIAPIDDIADKLIDFRGRTEKQAQLYLFFLTRQEAAPGIGMNR